MDDRRFRSSIVIEPRLCRYREVRSVKEAATILLRQWPDSDSPKRRKAMETCLLALKGDVQPHKARKAFMEAAREARLLP